MYLLLLLCFLTCGFFSSDYETTLKQQLLLELSSDTNTTVATPNSSAVKSSIYSMVNRNTYKPKQRKGIKNFQNEDESYLADLYMAPCCISDSIRKLFPFGNFCAKCCSYTSLGLIKIY